MAAYYGRTYTNENLLPRNPSVGVRYRVVRKRYQNTTQHYHETGEFPSDAAEQAELAFDHIEAALAEANANLADVLRVVVFLADRDDLMPVCEIVGRKFAEIRPANTTVVATLALPEMKVEIEVTARRGSAA